MHCREDAETEPYRERKEWEDRVVPRAGMHSFLGVNYASCCQITVCSLETPQEIQEKAKEESAFIPSPNENYLFAALEVE